MKSAFWLGFILIAFSCTYKPEEEIYFKEIAQTFPTSTITLNQIDTKDTIFLSQTTSFHYDVKIEKVRIWETLVTLGTTKLYSPYPSGDIQINVYQHGTGVYQLKIGYISPSNTGSLGDRSDIEKVTAWKTWIVAIDIDPPPTPIITSTNENGFLKISWPAHKRKNFIAYDVFLSGAASKQITIKDSNKNFYIDSSYVGGFAKQFVVSTTNGATRVTGPPTVINEPQEVTINYNQVDSTTTFNWKASKFTKAFKNIEILEDNTVIATITNSAQTAATLKLKKILFGGSYKFTFKINANYPSNTTYQFSYSKDLLDPLRLPRIAPGQDFYFSFPLSRVIGYDPISGKIRVYDSSMKVVDSVNVGSGAKIPYPSNYVYYIVAGGFAQLNLSTKIVKTYNTVGLNGTTLITPSAISASDNQLVNYRLSDVTNPGIPITNVIDMATNSVLISNSGQFTISDDGRYCFPPTPGTPVSLYKIQGASIVATGVNVPIHSFRQDNNDEMITRGTTTEIRATATGALLRSINVPAGNFLRNYDPVTKTLSINTFSNEVHLVNIETGAVKIINVNGTGFSLINGILISSTGYYLKVL